MKYKGYELLKAIAEGNIKEETKFTFRTDENIENVCWDGKNFKYIDTDENIMAFYPDIKLINGIFELIEDEIDIQSIEEIDIDQVIETDDKTGIALLHINKLIKAVKQLNKEIQELKEK